MSLPPVVILAAGRGSRMKHLTTNQQKTMLELDGKPLLEITVERFANVGFTNFIFVVGYRKESIIDHFSGYNHVTFVEQANIKGGTADAVRIVEHLIDSKSFVLVYGDIVPSIETVEMLRDSIHQSAVMAVRIVPDPERYGVVETDGDLITRIHEKSQNPPSNLVNAGLYVLPQSIFEHIHATPISARGEYELTTSIEMWIDANNKTNRMYWKRIDDSSLDIGTIDEYQKAAAK